MKMCVQAPTASSTHLLGVWDVTGIGQDKSAKLVKILYCPPPPVWRTEPLKHRQVIETSAASNIQIPTWRWHDRADRHITLLCNLPSLTDWIRRDKPEQNKHWHDDKHEIKLNKSPDKCLSEFDSEAFYHPPPPINPTKKRQLMLAGSASDRQHIAVEQLLQDS